LLEEYESVRPHRGQIVQGKILAMTEDAVILDVGAKRDAIVPRRELGNLDNETVDDLSIGDQLPVYITSTSNYDNELLVSIEKGLEQQDWERAASLLESEETLELEVVGYNKGGLLVEFGRLSGFVPNSMIPNLPRGLDHKDKQTAKSKMIGESLTVKIIEVNQAKKHLVMSGRAVESAHRQERLQELEALVGERITGTVANVVKFGVFVDLDGVDGLIHVSRLSWDKVDHPSDVLHPGDEVEVLIKDVDVERGRISLDRRALMPGPWDQFAERFHPDDVVEGTVKSVRDFGAFVRLTDQVTGLVHTSELFRGSSQDPVESLTPGEKVLVKILEIDPVRERVALSMRRVPQDDITHWMLESQDYSIQPVDEEPIEGQIQEEKEQEQPQPDDEEIH
jgi:small subunit ribosomal protein S1